MILAQIRIVLVEPSHPGNIGGVARAMKNMGLSQLCLVKPQFFPHDEATARAAGAVDVLDHAVVYQRLSEAISDCQWVIGCTALLRNTEQKALTPREAAARINKTYPSANVAFIFGRESSGLTNQELQQCHAQLQIPANPVYSSLNLATAVQIISYELWLMAQAALPKSQVDNHADYASVAQQENFYRRLDELMTATGFYNPHNPRSLHKKIRGIFTRANLSAIEVNVLLGLLKSINERIRGEE